MDGWMDGWIEMSVYLPLSSVFCLLSISLHLSLSLSLFDRGGVYISPS